MTINSLPSKLWNTFIFPELSLEELCQLKRLSKRMLEVTAPVLNPELAEIETLDLSNKKLVEFDAEIRLFPNITSLDLSGNRIQSVASLASFARLRILNLESNELGNCSALIHVACLPSLTVVVLTRNPLAQYRELMRFNSKTDFFFDQRQTSRIDMEFPYQTPHNFKFNEFEEIEYWESLVTPELMP